MWTNEERVANQVMNSEREARILGQLILQCLFLTKTRSCLIARHFYIGINYLEQKVFEQKVFSSHLLFNLERDITNNTVSTNKYHEHTLQYGVKLFLKDSKSLVTLHGSGTGTRTGPNDKCITIWKCSYWSQRGTGTSPYCFLLCQSHSLYLSQSCSRAVWLYH